MARELARMSGHAETPRLDETVLAALPGRFRAAARRVGGEFAAQPAVQAVLLAGSILRGEAGPHSDLDLFIIAEGMWRQRRSFVVDGVMVETFYNPPGSTRRYFATSDAHAMHMVGFGAPLYVRPDAAAGIVALQAEARAAYARGPAPLDAPAQTAQRYAVLDAWFDAEDALAAGDVASASLALAPVLTAALEAYYARQRAWRPKWKRLLPDLAAWDPALATQVRAYCGAATAAEQHAILRAILTAIFPEGIGVEAWCWASAADPVAPDSPVVALGEEP